jgi:uncharacterized protein
MSLDTDTSKVKMNSLDGAGLKTLAAAGLTWLRTNQQTLNDLNVFPVPDGDTGTNMVLTMQAALDETTQVESPGIGKIAHAIAQGALMGARGNSGVILSQIWRGFARVLDDRDVMDAATFAEALCEARNTAYKGVVRPVEGTILTVASDISIAAEKVLPETVDLIKMLEKIVNAADESVKHTPELLPILKQAGVVDSGGKGLFFIFEGMLRHLNKESLGTPIATVQPLSLMNLGDSMESIEPGQDYEVVIDFRPGDHFIIEQYFDTLENMGTSIQVGEGDDIYRMHIHVPTENRYLPIDYTMEIGTVTDVHIENLMDQFLNGPDPETPQFDLADISPGDTAVIVVSPGPGISRIFASLGVAAIVEGGQSMNPSTEEILKTFEDLPTDKIIILPNNKNILLAARATTSISVKNIEVIPATSIPQGLNAALRLMPGADFDTVVASMNDSLDEVETGEITIATRTVEINGVNVQEGEVIALHNGKLVESTSNLEQACLSMLESAETQEKERITLFYGNNITKPEVDGIVNTIQSAYPDHEIEVHEGGQPYYQFILSIE